MNLLEIGKIVRVHGIKGAVKIMCYIDESFSKFKHVYLTDKKQSANIKQVINLNNGACAVIFDIIPDIDTAEKYRNQSVYIDRDEYPDYEDKIYFSDLINKPVLNEHNEKLGEMIDFDDYGASVVLTIKCGAVSYSIPYVEEFISFNRELDAFVIEEQKFKDLRV